MRQHKRSRGLRGFVERHRVATTFVTLFLMASPARPDDRQLLQANAGANTNVLLILDSSHSMNNDFSDTYRLPAFMDDFIYPGGHGRDGGLAPRRGQERAPPGHDQHLGRELGLLVLPQPRSDLRRRGHERRGRNAGPADRGRHGHRAEPGERRPRVDVLRRRAVPERQSDLGGPADRRLSRRSAGPLPPDGPQGSAHLRNARPARPAAVHDRAAGAGSAIPVSGSRSGNLARRLRAEGLRGPDRVHLRSPAELPHGRLPQPGQARLRAAHEHHQRPVFGRVRGRPDRRMGTAGGPDADRDEHADGH